MPGLSTTSRAGQALSVQGYCQGTGNGSKWELRTVGHTGCMQGAHLLNHVCIHGGDDRTQSQAALPNPPCALWKQEPLHKLLSALSPAIQHSRREPLQLHRESSLRGTVVIFVVLWLMWSCQCIPRDGCTAIAGHVVLSPVEGLLSWRLGVPRAQSSREVPYLWNVMVNAIRGSPLLRGKAVLLWGLAHGNRAAELRMSV